MLTQAGVSQAEQRYYRYVDDNGVKVINSAIPPEFVKNGYEVVTISGRVIEVVEPAPSADELEAFAERREREARLADWDDYLLKRYSTVDDIRRAKKRKVTDFEASVSILRGNASSIQTQIEIVQARAADIERQGGTVPQHMMSTLADLEKELAETNRLIDIRKEDQIELENKFDQDIERFGILRPETKPDAAEESKEATTEDASAADASSKSE